MPVSDDRPAFAREGRDWPNREASRFVTAGGLTWHVQEAGEGPVLLLVHGTGAATHSWRGLMPLLARDFRVIAPDLPATASPTRCRRRPCRGWPGRSRSSCASSTWRRRSPSAIPPGPRSWPGSASMAPCRRASSSGSTRPETLSGHGRVHLPGDGAGPVPQPVTPRVFAWSADRAAVERLIAAPARPSTAPASTSTGACSRPPATWPAPRDDGELGPRRPRPRPAPPRPPTLLIVGGQDRTIAPDVSFGLADRLGGRARVELLRGLGHLAHEERPELVAELIRAGAERSGVV